MQKYTSFYGCYQQLLLSTVNTPLISFDWSETAQSGMNCHNVKSALLPFVIYLLFAYVHAALTLNDSVTV